MEARMRSESRSIVDRVEEATDRPVKNLRAVTVPALKAPRDKPKHAFRHVQRRWNGYVYYREIGAIYSIVRHTRTSGVKEASSFASSRSEASAFSIDEEIADGRSETRSSR